MKVSVVIPAYNQADFLGKAIQSVLDQTYQEFEIIVVDDASPDHTAEVVAQVHDPRVKCITHEVNRGLPAARNTGMKATTGELIALLDSDDVFHPEKLERHVHFFAEHSEIGVAYNGRFELNYSAETIRELYLPPPAVGLADFVLGFPFTPSDMVLRREWAFRVNLFDENLVCGAEDLDFPCRLALTDCQFGRINKALNYRRHHSGRYRTNLDCRIDDVQRALNKVFADPRCPDSVRDLRNRALATHYLVLAFHALMQDRTTIGQRFLRKGAKLMPTIVLGKVPEIVSYFCEASVQDESLDHVAVLEKLFAQLPPEMSDLARHQQWAVRRGYLLKATRALIWGRHPEGHDYLNRAISLGATLDDSLVHYLAHQLISYWQEFGDEQADIVRHRLITGLSTLSTRKELDKLDGCYSVNQAFTDYRNGNYSKVPHQILTAIRREPRYIGNRGVWSILVRSCVNAVRTV